MSDITRRTVFYYRDKKKFYNASGAVIDTVECIKFHPFCRVLINGQHYIEPWNGVVTGNWKFPDIQFADFVPDNSCNIVTSVEEIEPDKFSILLTGDPNDTRLHGGTPYTKVGR
jgi:hypothetical protein